MLSIFGGGGDRSSSLGTGSDPTKIVGNEKRLLASRAVLPTKTNASTVVEASGMAGRTEAQSQLLAQLSRHQQRVAGNLVAILKTRVEHSKAMMKIEREVQQLDAQQSKAITRFHLGVAENKANLSGFDSEMQRAAEIINF
jgi:hypothetical protein